MTAPLRWGLSLAILVAVGALAVAQGPSLVATLVGIEWSWAVAGLGAFLGGHLLRSLRLAYLAGGALPVWPTAVAANAFHAVAVYLLPLQSGELTLPGVLRWATGQSLLEGVRILIRLRLLDVAAMGAWISVAAALLPAGRIAAPARLACLGAGLALALFPWALRSTGGLAAAVPDRLARALAPLRGVGRLSVSGFCLSAALWGLSGGSVWACAQAVGLPLGFLDVWVLMALQLPLQFLPLQGVANAGSHELSWVGGLALLGFSGTEALRFALASHALVLCYVGALAPLGAAAWLWRNKAGSGSPESGDESVRAPGGFPAARRPEVDAGGEGFQGPRG